MTQTNYIERYWRDAKPEDVTKPQWMVARFKHYPDGFPGNWEIAIDLLGGFSRDKSGAIVEWFDSSGNRFNNAQVYDAPDPGEGWRLLDIDKDTKQKGDEYLHPDGTWKKADKAPFSKIRPYRRRITPTVTYVPFTWEDREQLRGRWYRVTLSFGEIRECQIEFFRLDRGVFFVGSFPSEQLLEKGAIFLDTGKPVGKEVSQ